MSRQRVHPGLLLRFAALVLAVGLPAGTAAAADFDPDVRLESRVLAALQTEPQLDHLIVSVRKGVVTLRGPLPTKALVQRAVECARRVPEVRDVRNECHLGAPPRPRIDSPPPQPVKPAPEPPPDLTVKRDTAPMTWVPWSPDALKLEPSRLRERPRTPAATVTVTLLPVIQIGVPAPTPSVMQPVSRVNPLAPPPEDETDVLIAQVQRLTRADDRYRRLRFDVRDGVVSISGVVPRWEDLHALSRTLTGVPGVERVVWLKVRADGKR